MPDSRQTSYGIVDTHAHLNDVVNVREAIADARSEGITAIVGVGMGHESNESILRLADTYPGYIFPAIGLHPWNLDPSFVENEFEFIENNLPSCAALGEIGLDYKIKVKKTFQKETLKQLLSLAVRFDKPVITHSRYSYESTFRLVRNSGLKKAIFHWYSGPMDLLDQIIEAGYFISATPALEYSVHHQEAIRKVPLENLLLETDCPVRFGEMDSRPRDVRTTLHLTAKIKNINMSTVAEITTRNALDFFGITIPHGNVSA